MKATRANSAPDSAKGCETLNILRSIKYKDSTLETYSDNIITS